MAARPDHHFQLEPHKSHWLEGIFRMRKYLRVCKSLMEDVAPATYPGGSKSRQVIFIQNAETFYSVWREHKS